MIFVTVGTQKFPFDRLLKKIDLLIEQKVITETVVAQTGYSLYKPKYYTGKEYMEENEIGEYLRKARLVIIHGGTGGIIEAVTLGKKVIAVPRQKRYKEHVDDHQIEIIRQFSEKEIILGVQSVDEIESALKEIETKHFQPYVSTRDAVIEELRRIIKK